MTGHDADAIRRIVALQHGVLKALRAVPDAGPAEAATALSLVLVQIWQHGEMEIGDLHTIIDEAAETTRDFAPPVAEC
jgi:hypothetical protein